MVKHLSPNCPNCGAFVKDENFCQFYDLELSDPVDEADCPFGQKDWEEHPKQEKLFEEER